MGLYWNLPREVKRNSVERSYFGEMTFMMPGCPVSHDRLRWCWCKQNPARHAAGPFGHAGADLCQP
ncbi:hypothetical protein EHS86_09655 [Erwinia amylovora]|uniref:Uncharacterized protein n=2 Tax=Erwinia amylovora TaxID=552 RepID=A0A831ETR6_ERWAM|nr:hypothetical protein AD997_02900 [Erwinia amylovora]EKV52481.1 hypothetical protein EaACW_3068 [Erwinia amylovora ACW56400]CBA22910.1 hypothetical protein predicted by Glimmer/Critica [Erwinia amylovora CFBP1430]CCO79909.1 hypothetical protein BN432_3133 [Erwinia amylovora Ea356]CCO87474.1 hypothetical protein BN434_3108 [Erwinia amylovora CFBP 2585]CCO91269.1 hypothetical protein BN435_3120 [Erwinia amylovora 01SFR-BO]CCO95055.1 hypothetical protein BN437_3148 [Erwinia amylovora NBRC 1268